MPFKSESQRKLFWAKVGRGEIKRSVAAEWEAATPKGKKLPEKVKHAAFLDELVKIAISRGAIELMKGTLSPQGAVRLRGALRPPEAMASGLARGSENLAKQLGVKIYDPTLTSSLRRVPGLIGSLRRGESIPIETWKQVAAPLAASEGGGGLTIGKELGEDMAGIYLDPSQTIMRTMGAKFGRGRIAALKELLGMGMSAPERKHLAEIVKRHEIDEARAAARPSSYKNVKETLWTPGWKNLPFTRGQIQTGGGLHADPRVLMEESRNLTFAPESVRNTMRDVRKFTMEQPGMLERAGVDLGLKTPPAGSRAARQAEKALFNVPTPTFLTPQGPVHVSPELQERGRALGASLKSRVGQARELARKLKSKLSPASS